MRNAIYNINPRDLYVKKDLLHVTENNYFHGLWNGDFLEVLNVGNTIEGPSLHIKSSTQKDGKEFDIDKTGYRLLFNTNADAMQTVFHIHLHLIGGEKLKNI